MIYLGSDHRGFELKEKIKKWLTEWSYEFKDFGPFSYDPEDDYPDFIRPVAEAISQDRSEDKGIILGASGQGEAMAANRFKNVRAAVFYGPAFVETSNGRGILEEIIRLSREHNDANILSVGTEFVSEDSLKQLIRLWLDTPFSEEERHVRRIKKIDA